MFDGAVDTAGEESLSRGGELARRRWNWPAKRWNSADVGRERRHHPAGRATGGVFIVR